jgi:8-oxo-dGTP pyrophosphatase MutT (NUDIX family)
VNYEDAIERIRKALVDRLPGPTAHERLAPQPRREWPVGFNMARIRNAAGLLLLFPVEDRAHLVLTVRAGTLERHSGQVSLPGGVIEPGETFEDAALREAHEEIALDTTRITVLGALTPLDIPVSGFRLHPIVASTPAKPHLHPADGEVARILDVSIDDLRDPANLGSAERLREGRRVTIPLFQVAGEEIWGATAMVLAELIAILSWDAKA